MKKQFVSEIISGKARVVDDVFVVRVKKPPVLYKGKKGSWFELRVADKTGEIAAKYWGSDDEASTLGVYNSIVLNSVVRIKGVAEQYDGTMQISVNHDHFTAENNYDITDFVATSQKDIEKMFFELKSVIESMQNQSLKNLLNSFFNDAAFCDKFKKTPAAMTYHQNWVGGLLEHVLNIIEICETVARIHKNLDRDLLLAGAILHDIGKVREFEVGTSIRITKEGQLLGHITLGYEMVKEKIGSDFDENLKNKILHMILSHQGKLEYASPKEPMFPEALALYYADECDSKTAYMLSKKLEANTESAWLWDKRLGRSIYLE